MQAGDLRHRIVIKYDANAGKSDDNANPIPDWQTLCTVWAKRQGLTGRAFYQAAALQAENDQIFIIRYRADIKAGMQIVEGNETFDIYVPTVDKDGCRQWLELHARAVVP